MEKTMMGLIDEKISLIATKLEELAVEYGPDVVDAAMMVVQINATQFLVIGLLGAVVLFFGLRLVITGTRINRHYMLDSTPARGQDGIGQQFIGGGLICTGAAGIIVGLLDIWNWVALINPQLYIAKRILDGVL